MHGLNADADHGCVALAVNVTHPGTVSRSGPPQIELFWFSAGLYQILMSGGMMVPLITCTAATP